MKSWLPFEWIAAVRFLLEGLMQTLVILAGIAIGVGVIVFMSAMLAGLQANFIKRVLTSQPQIQLIPPDQVARPLRTDKGTIEAAIVQRPTQRVLSIDQWPKIRVEMQNRPDIVTVAPTVSGSGLALRGDTNRAITLTGIEPEVYFRIVRVPDYIVAGGSQITSEGILIGTELAKDLGASLGDKINVTTAMGGNRILTINGIFDLGNKGANQRSTFVALRTAQSLLGLIGGVTSIDLTVTDIYAAETIAREIAAMLPVQADSWIKTNAQFFTAVQAQQNSNTLIRAFVGLSVAFGIAAVLIVSVIQRSKDIGILRAMGTKREQILRVFLIQGGILGFLGALIGSALGAFALIVWHRYARQVDGSELFPLILETQLFVMASGLATLTGVVAAIAPALRAANLDPVVAIRG
ncbi:lipoprotein-releasing system permease protein [Rhodopseudomonas rhenobacensis]|uniref:Lipoprotein-releasing system permease protein n=1 Tax=Rhodopseudomonas rhenobacensis TaxID=87461 RepID=A0A7W7Z4C0_9BRAD|nr:FtsX-like permease family protein [Rhodopseudomonas rhenobacensis]MBB5047397.1 lipoprotein-releasing system permease protein [Rhodopseudomonas rhenobacensis]